MTDHPTVAYLRNAHERAEQMAKATTPVPAAGEWVAVRDKHADRDKPLALVQGLDPDRAGLAGEEWLDAEDYAYGLPVIAYSADWQDEAEVNLRFIAANNPAAVLARVAAERAILAECERILAMDGWEYDDAPQLAELVIAGLARGWGWTEDGQHG